MKRKNWVIVIVVIVVALVAAACIYGYVSGRQDEPDTPSVNEPEVPQPGTPDDKPDEPDGPVLPDEPDPSGGEPVVIYVPDEQAETLTPVGADAADGSDQALVNALIDAGSLPAGVEVQSAEVVDGVLQLDMNTVYGDAVRASGTTGETVLIYALVNTFAQARGVEQVLVTVDGAPLESGHDIYDYPLTMDYTQ